MALIKCGGVTVWKVSKSLGLSFKRGRPIVADQEQVKKMFLEGKPPREIMNHFGLSSLAYYRKRLGIGRSKKGRPSGKTKSVLFLSEQCRKWKHEGFTYSQIAKDKLHGKVSYQWVQQLVTEQPKFGIGTCPNCHEPNKKLNRHHTNYLLDIVVPLCGSCHQKIHKSKTSSKNNC